MLRRLVWNTTLDPHTSVRDLYGDNIGVQFLFLFHPFELDGVAPELVQFIKIVDKNSNLGFVARLEDKQGFTGTSVCPEMHGAVLTAEQPRLLGLASYLRVKEIGYFGVVGGHLLPNPTCVLYIYKVEITGLAAVLLNIYIVIRSVCHYNIDFYRVSDLHRLLQRPHLY